LTTLCFVFEEDKPPR